MTNLPPSESPKPENPTGRHSFRDPKEELAAAQELIAYYKDRAESLGDQVRDLENRNKELTQTLGVVGVELTRANIYTKRSAEQHDEKTGLLNSKGFELAIEEAKAAQERDGIVRACIFADAVQFKGINNHPELGHEKGDGILVRMGDRMVKAVRVNSPEDAPVKDEDKRSISPRHAREQDIVARLGGDEFGLIVKLEGDSGKTPEQILQSIEQRLKESVAVIATEGHPDAHPQAKLLKDLGFGIYVGYTRLDPAATPKELKERANHEMVNRKNAIKEAAAKEAERALEQERAQVPEQEPPTKGLDALKAMNRTPVPQPGDNQTPGDGKDSRAIHLDPEQQYRGPGKYLGR